MKDPGATPRANEWRRRCPLQDARPTGRAGATLLNFPEPDEDLAMSFDTRLFAEKLLRLNSLRWLRLPPGAMGTPIVRNRARVRQSGFRGRLSEGISRVIAGVWGQNRPYVIVGDHWWPVLGDHRGVGDEIEIGARRRRYPLPTHMNLTIKVSRKVTARWTTEAHGPLAQGPVPCSRKRGRCRSLSPFAVRCVRVGRLARNSD